MKYKNILFVVTCFVLGGVFTVGYPYVDYLLLGSFSRKVGLILLTIFSFLGILFYLIAMYYFLNLITKYNFKVNGGKRIVLNLILFLMILISGATSLFSIFNVGMSWG